MAVVKISGLPDPEPEDEETSEAFLFPASDPDASPKPKTYHLDVPTVRRRILEPGMPGGIPWFDVTHPRFGARKDDSSFDSGPAINLAIEAAAEAGGGEIKIPGKFYARTPIWIPAGFDHGITLVGSRKRHSAIITDVLLDKPLVRFGGGPDNDGTRDASGSNDYLSLYGGISNLSLLAVPGEGEDPDTSLYVAANNTLLEMIELGVGEFDSLNVEGAIGPNGFGIKMLGSITAGPGGLAGPHCWRNNFWKVLVVRCRYPWWLENVDENDFFACEGACPTGYELVEQRGYEMPAAWDYVTPANNLSAPVPPMAAIHHVQGRNNRWNGTLLGGDSDVRELTENPLTGDPCAPTSAFEFYRPSYVGYWGRDQVLGDVTAMQFRGIVSEGFDADFYLQSGQVLGVTVEGHNSSISRKHYINVTEADSAETRNGFCYFAPIHREWRVNQATPYAEPLDILNAVPDAFVVKSALETSMWTGATSAVTNIATFSDAKAGMVWWVLQDENMTIVDASQAGGEDIVCPGRNNIPPIAGGRWIQFIKSFGSIYALPAQLKSAPFDILNTILACDGGDNLTSLEATETTLKLNSALGRDFETTFASRISVGSVLQLTNTAEMDGFWFTVDSIDGDELTGTWADGTGSAAPASDHLPMAADVDARLHDVRILPDLKSGTNPIAAYDALTRIAHFENTRPGEMYWFRANEYTIVVDASDTDGDDIRTADRSTWQCEAEEWLLLFQMNGVTYVRRTKAQAAAPKDVLNIAADEFVVPDATNADTLIAAFDVTTPAKIATIANMPPGKVLRFRANEYTTIIDASQAGGIDIRTFGRKNYVCVAEEWIEFIAMPGVIYALTPSRISDGDYQVPGDLDVGGTIALPSTGAAPRVGEAVLVGGTVTIATTAATAATIAQLTRKTTGGAIGDLTYTIVDGVSLTIDSASATDTSTVAWLLLEKN